jgi:WbqC-like protein family
MLVAIHQPNFFPWLGYFDKIWRADLFIVLDAVAYPRSGSGGMGSWTNRVRLGLQGQPHWITCPIRRMPLGTAIRDVQIDDSRPWRSKLIRTLEMNFKQSATVERARHLLDPLLLDPETNLASFNIAAITAIAGHLGLTTPLIRQSSLNWSGQGTELLISLVKGVGGTAYLAGGGASGYQEDHLFAEAGIKLVYQNFQPRPYGQHDNFLPGLSVIDYLMQDRRSLEELFAEAV